VLIDEALAILRESQQMSQPKVSRRSAPAEVFREDGMSDAEINLPTDYNDQVPRFFLSPWNKCIAKVSCPMKGTNSGMHAQLPLTPRRIAILGASGSVGGALATHILRARLLEPQDQLLLVGHGVLATERKLLSMRTDLMDAFDEDRVRIEVVPDVSDVEADFVVVAAGTTAISATQTRRDLATTNRVIFEQIADQCVTRLSEAWFIVVSNPVELAVKIFSFAGDRNRVIGMGAQQDSLRFARAIAADLGMSRHNVRATVLGEHGDAMIPLWRSVELMTDDPRAADRLARLRTSSAESPLGVRVASLRSEVSRHLSKNRIFEAYALTQRASADARIFVEPSITFHSLCSTPNATANATLELLAAALANDHRRIHGQVDLRGEVLGLYGVCGIPLTIGKNGWHAEPLDWLDSDEIRAVRKSTESIEEFTSGVLIDAVRATLPPEELFVFEGLTFDKHPPIREAAGDDFARHERGRLN
jgi:malate dehydrogenase